MKEKIIHLGKGGEGIVLPQEYLRYLELTPGTEVRVELDKEGRRIIIRPLRPEDFLEHFKSSMERMA